MNASLSTTTLSLALCLALAAPASAEDIDRDRFLADLVKVGTAMTLAEAHGTACDALYPDNAAPRRYMMAMWTDRVDLTSGRPAIAALIAREPQVAEQIAAQKDTQLGEVLHAASADPMLCSNLATTLRHEVGRLRHDAQTLGVTAP